MNGATDQTVITFYSTVRKGFFSQLSNRKDFPALDHTVSLFEVVTGPAEDTCYQLITGEDDYDRLKRASSSTVAAVSRLSFPLTLGFTPLVKDPDGADLDLRVEGLFAVADPLLLLSRVPFRHCPPSLVESLIRDGTAGSLALEVENLITRHGHTFLSLSAGIDLSSGWFQSFLNQFLHERGLSVSITGTQWTSAEAQENLERASRIQVEKNQVALVRELTVLQEEKERVEAELRRRREHRKRVERLDRHQAELDQLEQRRQIREAEIRLGALEREQELAALQHKAALLDVTRESTARHEIDRHITGIRKDLDALRETLQTAHQGFQEIKEVIGPLQDFLINPVTALYNGHDEPAHQIREMLVSPAGWMSPGGLEALGITADLQAIVQFFSSKAVEDGHLVNVQMEALQSRSLPSLRGGQAHPVTVPQLAVNSPLRFHFTSRRQGYVTLLNLGTSGTVYCHIPNTWVPSGQVRIRPGFTYPIPGDGLIPPDRLRENQLFYGEAGPAGWEHLILLITAAPLDVPADFSSITPQDPFPVLDREAAAQLVQALKHQPADDWSVGVLSFFVTESPWEGPAHPARGAAHHETPPE